MRCFVWLVLLGFLNKCFGLFKEHEEPVTSYTDCFKSEFKYGEVIEIVKEPYSRVSCAMKCLRNSFCTTAIIDERENVCFLSKLSKTDEEEMKTKGSNTNGRFSHVQLLGPVVGQEYVPFKNKVFKNCRSLKNLHTHAPSGVYWINPRADQPFQAYCDHKTSGGGWTLVWSYRFTDYKNFDSTSNAVTPLPNWTGRPGASGSRFCQQSSEKPPLSEEQTGAMLFSLWSKIGDEVLFKSNIMNWISCSPLDGDFVRYRPGSISCRVVRNLIGRCGDVVPTLIARRRGPECGPKLLLRHPRPSPPRPRPPRPRPPKISSVFIDFNGNTRRGWPVHDSCATCQPTQLQGVAIPRGYVFIR